MKSQMKDDITKTFIKLGNMPESIDSDDIYALEYLVKSVYYGGMKKLKDRSPNEFKKDQFTQSTSNDMRKIAPSSDTLCMQLLRAIHTAGLEWVECLHVSLPDSSVWGYILKNDVFVPKWLYNPPTFILATFKCKCAQLNIPYLPLCHCNRKCKRV